MRSVRVPRVTGRAQRISTNAGFPEIEYPSAVWPVSVGKLVPDHRTQSTESVKVFFVLAFREASEGEHLLRCAPKGEVREYRLR